MAWWQRIVLALVGVLALILYLALDPLTGDARPLTGQEAAGSPRMEPPVVKPRRSPQPFA
jgi:hypothetical protein